MKNIDATTMKELYGDACMEFMYQISDLVHNRRCTTFGDAEELVRDVTNRFLKEWDESDEENWDAVQEKYLVEIEARYLQIEPQALQERSRCEYWRSSVIRTISDCMYDDLLDVCEGDHTSVAAKTIELADTFIEDAVKHNLHRESDEVRAKRLKEYIASISPKFHPVYLAEDEVYIFEDLEIRKTKVTDVTFQNGEWEYAIDAEGKDCFYPACYLFSSYQDILKHVRQLIDKEK